MFQVPIRYLSRRNWHPDSFTKHLLKYIYPPSARRRWIFNNWKLKPQGPDSIALILFGPFFSPFFGPFFGPLFEIAYWNDTLYKEFLHMLAANWLSVPFSVPFLMLLSWLPGGRFNSIYFFRSIFQSIFRSHFRSIFRSLFSNCLLECHQLQEVHTYACSKWTFGPLFGPFFSQFFGLKKSYWIAPLILAEVDVQLHRRLPTVVVPTPRQRRLRRGGDCWKGVVVKPRLLQEENHLMELPQIWV